jgi:hypothetical protein
MHFHGMSDCHENGITRHFAPVPVRNQYQYINWERHWPLIEMFTGSEISDITPIFSSINGQALFHKGVRSIKLMNKILA